MKKIIALVLSCVMLFGMVSVLGACGEPDDPGAKIGVYLGEEIYDFDPSDYYVNDNAAQMMSLLFEPLFKLDDDGDRKKAIADDYDIDKEEKTITIELAESYWSDNVRVTADDFIFAWRNVLLNPANANPAAALLYDIKNALEVKNGLVSLYDLGIKKLDIYKFEITYRDGADPERLLDNLASLATSPIRQDKYESSEGFWSKQSGTMVFNGPFQVVELDFDATENPSFKLERNVGYHQSPITVDYDDEVRPYKLYSFFSAEGNEMRFTYSDLVNNTVFYMCDAPLADRSANKAEATVADTFSTYSYVFNLDNPLFAIEEVRQALSLAIDRNAIVNAITFGTAATGFVPSVVKDAATEKSFRDGNTLINAGAQLDAAKALLELDDVKAALAGIEKKIILTVNDDKESIAIAELVKAAWEELGFTVEIEALGRITTKVTKNQVEVADSWIQYIVKSNALGNESERDPKFTATTPRYNEAAETYYTGFDVIAVDWQFYTDDAFVGLASLATAFNGCGVDFATASQRDNLSGWTNVDYNAYINTAYKTFDEEARSAALHSAEKIIVDSMPVIPLVFNQNFSFCSDSLKKVKLDGFGNFIFTDAKLKNYEDYYSRYED